MPDSHEINIYSTFADTANRRSEHPAVIYLGNRFSYRRVKGLAERFAAALNEIGVEPGQKVMMYIPNSIQWVISWLGIQKLGAVAVPITPIYTPHDLQYIANDSDAQSIICADTNFGYVTSVLSKTRLKTVIVTNVADLLPWWKRSFGILFDVIPRGKFALDGRTSTFKDLLSRRRSEAHQRPLSARAGAAIAEILYTGGTTKFPKGVPFSHNLFLVSADEQIRMSEPLFPAEENIVMGNAPLFHILGQTCSLATLLTGGTLILQPRINLDANFDAIQRFGAKTMIGVPALYRMMLEHVRLDQYDLSSLKYCFSGGDVLPVEVGKRWQEKFGIPIYQGYGATETCGGVAMCPTNVANPPKSVGRIVNSKKVKIVNPADLEPVATGEPGELLVSSTYMVSTYLNKPEETAQAFVELDGETWYRTADIMSLDQDGNLYFVDRTVDTIKHKGYRVSASEIESVLQEHPAVIASCAVGVPDEKVGERIKAYVVLKEDIKGITGYELIKWCRRTLVAYKVPQYIEFRDMLPKSKVGKLLRREIRSEEQRRKET
jgi:long-chain acyl-CoA synthetase